MEKINKATLNDENSRLRTASNRAHEVIDNATLRTYEVANKIVDKGDELSDIAHQTVDKATTTTQQAIDTMSKKKDQLKNVEQRVLANYSTYVRDNPITSLSIAIGVGFLLNKLLNKR